jgi:uncharacterized protein (DUF849 family)
MHVWEGAAHRVCVSKITHRCIPCVVLGWRNRIGLEDELYLVPVSLLDQSWGLM